MKLRKCYTKAEFNYVMALIRKEYIEEQHPDKQFFLMFSRQEHIMSNEEMQKRFNQKGFIFDPLGDNIEGSMECFDIYSESLPLSCGSDDSVSDYRWLNWYINTLRRKPVTSLRWVKALKASSPEEALKQYATSVGLAKEPEDIINPNLYTKRIQVPDTNIVFRSKYAIFAK